MLEVRKSADRGVGKLEWLDANFTFSFGPYHDPEQIGFSDLRLLNDDRVKGGGGFATHEHRDTEVFSYVISGALEHKDSMDYGSVVRAGEVLTMSTGTGITHSEFNHSPTDPVHFLQVWLVPDRKGVVPRYGQKQFTSADKRGRLACIIAPDAREGALPLYLDGCVYAGLIDGSERAEVTLAEGRYAYVHVIRGELDVNGTRLSAGDGARIRHESKIVCSGGRNAEVLLFDLRPRELPEV
jgi:redox-sensitive bicupin YhaK (pirin superfamily)